MPTRRTSTAPAAPRSRGDVVISDARAMKALAHPARLTAVDELYAGRDLTASELAALCGLTASAMSYHLRALERWGVVERASARGDRRERPWRAAGPHLEIRPGRGQSEPGASGRSLAETFALQSVDRLRVGVHEWFERSADDPWPEVGRVSSGTHYLTHDEALSLAAEVDQVLDRYRGGAGPRRRRGARRVAVVYAQYPAEPAGSAGPAGGEGR